MMTTNMKGYNEEEVRKDFKYTLEGQFEHDLYNKSFSNQIESDETDTLHQRIDWRMTVIDR